jgi:hypothetical protein
MSMMDYDKPDSVGKPTENMLSPEDQQAEQDAQQQEQQMAQLRAMGQVDPQGNPIPPSPMQPNPTQMPKVATPNVLPFNRKKKPPEGLQGGNGLMQTARQDQFKEYADLKLKQAFEEVENA